MSRRAQNHVEAEIVPAPPAPLADCEIAEPVRLSSIGLTNGATIDMPNRPILDCKFAITFTEFAWDLMAPLATAMLGSGIAYRPAGCPRRRASSVHGWTGVLLLQPRNTG